MADSDALLVVQDWISEHYFTTDSRKESFLGRTLERVKDWKAAEHPTTKSRFTGERVRLAAALASLYADEDTTSATSAEAVHSDLRRILGYDGGPYTTTIEGPVRFVATPGEQRAALAIVDARPVDALDDLFAKHGDTLAQPFAAPDGHPLFSASRLVSTLFLADEAPAFALIMAGRWLVVAEASRWPEGRYLAVDIQTVAERGDLKQGGEVDRALTCVDAASLAPDADGDVWWAATLEASVRHTVGVSADLREGVRESIEIIANEVVNRRRTSGLDPLPRDQAQPLALQSLRFLYRILFLLYAEASPELAVLPVGDPDYDNGYSLDRLRELIQTELATPSARNGTHLYESLALLFRLVDQGHRLNTAPSKDVAERGLEFEPLRADLFKSEATALIDETGLGNDVLQRVLRRLLLSKEARGKERGFISYVELGINQLGAVYEGLMSYSGSFADVDLYEVAHGGNPEKGSWVVPQDRAEHLDEKDFVVDIDELTGQRSRRRYSKGEFVFRLSGRERQRSASYYTPEVLTKFTVSQALEELLDQDDTTTSADDILTFSVCEPALGSGAFAIEATRQLADEYLRRKQDELGIRIEPEDYPQELQRTKAFIAIHNVYGVDLNATAVEFAEITLWLDTMAKGLAAPWFGLRLRRGNSLVGASRSFYSRAQVNDKSWLTTPPTDEPLADLADRVARDEQTLSGANGRIHHFLLPAKGWGSTADAKEAKQLAPDRANAVRQWRRKVVGKPTKKQLDTLAGISAQADELWGMAYKRLLVAEQESARSIPLFGQSNPSPFPEQPRDEGAGRVEGPPTPHVTREQIEDSLANPNGAYQRLRRVMDAWCALWFWPLTGDEVEPPTLDQWIDAAAQILGNKAAAKSKKSEDFLRATNAWDALAEEEDFALAATGARPVAEVRDANPWLRVCEDVSATQGFFHWQLDFATIFGRGGFDLQVGNPPWVRPIVDSDALLADSDPWWQLAQKPSEAQRKARREETLELPGATDGLVDGATEVVGLASFVGDVTTYPHLQSLQPDLYRCFMSRTWRNGSRRGIISLIHPESHFTDEKAGLLRAATYPRLRRHWQFVNELRLFDEVHNLVSYGVHTYGVPLQQPDFLNASGLYHPDTIARSRDHNGDGVEPGFKYEGRWDQRPHASRLQRVTLEELTTWRDVLESTEDPVGQTRMLYTVNRSAAQVLAKLAISPRAGSIGLKFSSGWHEKIDRQKGRFIQRWGTVESWDDAILQGPHLFVGSPFYKSPNAALKSNKDWSSVDLETLAPNALPVTAYKPAGDRTTYDVNYGNWNDIPVREHYRIAWRYMAATSGERTLIPALLPPNTAHTDGISSAGTNPSGSRELVISAGVFSSILSDQMIRSLPKSTIRAAQIESLALPATDHPLIPRLLLRTLRLNCLTDAYADLWSGVWDPAFAEDEWLLDPGYPDAPRLGDVGPVWTPEVPLRRDVDRRNALVEIDALMATMLGITADELSTIYRTQFAVLHGYDQNAYIFDANGRIVPTSILQVWRRKGDKLTEEERTATHPAGTVYTYDLPFAPRDREADFHTAWSALSRGAPLNDQGSKPAHDTGT